jgi:hypothetical protein
MVGFYLSNKNLRPTFFLDFLGKKVGRKGLRLFFQAHLMLIF